MRVTTIRAGDHVLHEPSGETWVVCRVKPETGRLATFGWPPSEALISDCVLKKACSDAEHADAVEKCEKVGR